MAITLVGTRGPQLSTTSVSPTPAWGIGQNRTAGNLLTCCVSAVIGATITAPSGWTEAGAPLVDGNYLATIYWRIATGGDAAPTFSFSSLTQAWLQLDEWTGNDSVSPLDAYGTAVQTGTTSLQVQSATNISSAGATGLVLANWTHGKKGGGVTLTWTPVYGALLGYDGVGGDNNANSVRHAGASYQLSPGAAGTPAFDQMSFSTAFANGGAALAVFKSGGPPATPVSASDSASGTDAASVTLVTESVSESGAGTESGSISASTSVSDSAAGTENASTQQTTYVTRGDTAAAADSATVISQAFLNVSDSASGTDSAAITQADIGVSDSGSAVDSASKIDEGNTTPQVSDSGSATEAVSIFVTETATETAAGTDTVTALQRTSTVTEAASAIDVASIFAALAVADSGTAVDAGSKIDEGDTNPFVSDSATAVDRVSLLAISSAESAVAADALPLTAMSQPDSAALSAETAEIGLQGVDAGTGADASAPADIGNPEPQVADSATAQDSTPLVAITATDSTGVVDAVALALSVSDSATETEFAVSPGSQFPVSAAEVGTAIDSVSLIAVSVEETGSAIEMNLISGDDFGFAKDAVLRVGVVAGDTAIGSDAAQQGPLTDSFGGADTAAGSEAATMFVTVSASDAGQAEDADLSQKAAADSAQWVDEIFDLLAMESDAASSVEDESLLRMSTVTEGVVTIGSGGPVQLVEKQEEFIGRKTVTAKGGPRKVVGSRGKSSVRR